MNRFPKQCDDPACPCRKVERPDREFDCVLNKALFMVIPPEGIHLRCPVHGQHFVRGNPVVCAEIPMG